MRRFFVGKGVMMQKMAQIENRGLVVGGRDGNGIGVIENASHYRVHRAQSLHDLGGEMCY
jgi:hypothetical protein